MRARRAAALVLCALLGGAGVAQLLGNGGVVGWLLAGFLLLGARLAVRPRPDALALVLRCVSALAGLVAILAGGVLLAWESGEVVVLRYTDEEKRAIAERLWVIDFEGEPCVATASDKRRVARLRASPQVELVRGGRVECRRAAVTPRSTATETERRAAERLFAEKYGLRLYATRALALFLGAPPGAEPVLIRLAPCGE